VLRYYTICANFLKQKVTVQTFEVFLSGNASFQGLKLQKSLERLNAYNKKALTAVVGLLKVPKVGFEPTRA
jgi:hypothetical protein